MILLVSHIDSWGEGGRVYLFFELLAHMVGGTRPLYLKRVRRSNRRPQAIEPQTQL